MTGTQTAPRLNSLLVVLASYRLAIYTGGLVVILLPLVLDRGVGYTLASEVRTALVAGSLGVMALTYLAERRVDTIREETAATHTERYSLRRRVAAAGAVAGISVGAYLASTGELVVGLLFVGGALLFGQLAFKRGENHE